ncbi:MAG: hypothetical protein M1376_13410 [Planctomycetes bacterium]|nr:hypothetical protein [Planctomycetota bacterium]
MRRVWAVATNTIRQAMRMKVAAVFIVLLLVLLPVMGFTATGDGTLKGRLQTFVSYGLSLTSLLLSLLTIIVSIYTVTSDIEHRQIYTVVTKPIRRYQIILGKVLGVIVLDVALLVLFAGIVYGVTAWLPKFVNATQEERQAVDNEFYTARASLVPPLADVQKEVEATYRKLSKEDLATIYPNMSQEEVFKQLTNRKRLEKRAAAVGQWLVWEFHNVKVRDPNQSLFVRFKYDVSVTPQDEQVYGRWQVGDPRQFQQGAQGPGQTPVWEQTRKDIVRKFHELEVPASVVAKDGYLAVGFYNPPPLNDTVVLFPLDDGLEVLYKADTFAGNFLRAALLILCRLVFLACLGALAASFLSFPVAILFCIVIFVTGTASGFIVDSFGYMDQNISRIYTYTVQAILQLLPQFDKYNPTKFLVPARLMTWSLLGEVALVMVMIKGLLLLALALLIFSFRELAKVVV